METKVVSMKALRYEKQYREFFSKPENVNMQLRVFLSGDTVKKSKIS